ncbi:MAG TPA: DUF1420 family protein [Polyangia bacterium]|nr:DUF1420 family protein [Polyangia bacterium]
MTAPPLGFLRLEDVVLPPPIPALLSVLMAAGLASLGWRLASRLRGGRPEALDAAAGFILSAAVTAVIVHGLALAQLSSTAVLRPLGWTLAATGAYALLRHHRALMEAARRELSSLRFAPRWEQGAVLLVAVTVIGLGAAALGPPTDADSIAYHLSVPLDWLRHGGAYPRVDWYCTRLIGVAESLNLLGLAAGTDSLGAALQVGGLVAAAVAAAALAPTDRDRRVAWLLVVGCPLVAFLVPNQKPQMLPAAATTVALVLAVRRFENFGPADALLAFACAAFALSSKISFILTAGFAVLIGLFAARKSGHFGVAFAIAAAAIILAWVPLLARNSFFFGDPISPFLERFRSRPDLGMLAFATHLRDAGGERDLATLLRLPLSILGTVHPSAITTTLGLGALAFIPAIDAKGPARLLLLAALAAIATCLLLGQLAPRFLLEPFLWAGAALAIADWSRVKKVVVAGLMVQGAASASVALFGAATLFPGALTAGCRDAVLTKAAYGYAEGKWLDTLLPTRAVIVEPQGFPLFAPRPFAVADPAMSDVPPAVGDEKLRALVEQFGVNTVVDDGAPQDGPYARLEKRCGVPLGRRKEFPFATRNPFNRAVYGAQVYVLRACFPQGTASQKARPASTRGRQP